MSIVENQLEIVEGNNDSQTLEEMRKKRRQYSKNYYTKNKEKVKERIKQRLDDNPDLKEKNRAQCLERYKRYYEAKKQMVKDLEKEPTEEFKELMDEESKLTTILEYARNKLQNIKDEKYRIAINK